MNLARRPRSVGRAVAPILGTVIMVGITLTAGTILWEYHFNLPTSAPSISYQVITGTSNPTWGDPTDCQPWPNTIAQYGSWQAAYTAECDVNESGEYSLMNTSLIEITQHSPTNIPLDLVDFTFICNGTTLVTGSLASMSWFPGSSTSPAPDAPKLGWCGTFHAGGYGGGAYGTLYNRLGMFVPVSNSSDLVQDGDVFILYIHTPGQPTDWSTGAPIDDFDDYHGAPPWCFTVPNICTIYLTYNGTQAASLLATIPVYQISGSGA